MVECERCRNAVHAKATICPSCGWSRRTDAANAERARLYRRAASSSATLRLLALLFGAVPIVIVAGIALGNLTGLVRTPVPAAGAIEPLFVGVLVGVLLKGASIVIDLLTEQVARACAPSDPITVAEEPPRATFGDFV